MKKGFSLVELIIVIAVIGVLAAILIPTFTNVVNKSNEKSALSDARNVMTSFISAAQAESTSGVPNLIAIVKKGGQLFVFAYLKSSGEIINHGANPFPCNEKASVKANAFAVLSALELAGACRPSIEPAATQFTEAHVKICVDRAGYSMKDMAVFPEYEIDADLFTDDAKIEIGNVPDTKNAVIAPTVDHQKELLTFTITKEDMEMLSSDEDGKIELDMSQVLVDIYDHMSGRDTFTGYGIIINDESGLGISSVDIKASSKELSDIMSGAELPPSYYPYITRSEAFTTYAGPIASDAVNETTAQGYAAYLKDNYGSSTLDTLSKKVTKGENLYVRHTDKAIAKKLFDLMYDNGFVYCFIPTTLDELNDEAGAKEPYKAFLSRYNESKENMSEGWKSSGSIKLYSAYDLVKNETTNANELKAGVFIFAWHENIVPSGTEYIMPDIKLLVTP